MLRAFLKWTALVFLVVESLGLIASLLVLGLKIAHGNDALTRASWGEITLEVILRLAIVGLISSAYLRLMKLSQLPLTITRQSALLSTRAVQSVLLAAIALYAVTAERSTGPAERVPFLSPWNLSVLALGVVGGSLFLRKTFLVAANEELRRDPHSEKGLNQWRKGTIVSMVVAMSIGLFGFILRTMGNARIVEWSYFMASVALLVLWRPRLDVGTGSPSNPFSNHKDADS